MGMGWQPDHGQSVMKRNNAWQFPYSANVMNLNLSLDALNCAKLSNSSSRSGNSSRNAD